MDPLTIIGLLAQFGPSILKAVGVGKKVEDVANIASAIATQVTGKADITEAADAMKADPALALEFQKQLIAQDTSFEQNYVDDKKDARARDIALASTPKGNVRANWLVGFALLIVVSCLVLVIFRPVTDEFAKNTLLLILGMFIRELGNIYSFEFGTTRRSQNKTDVLNTISTKD